ncbi:hypothetical protein [Laceyella putida]|uniref:Uncharacterized protein n=1 Tax=Laceyella putida TaxID=110101 RepID=A0ABW2RHR0_9BACL
MKPVRALLLFACLSVIAYYGYRYVFSLDYLTLTNRSGHWEATVIITPSTDEYTIQYQGPDEAEPDEVYYQLLINNKKVAEGNVGLYFGSTPPFQSNHPYRETDQYLLIIQWDGNEEIILLQ